MISYKSVDIEFSYMVHFSNNEVLQSERFWITFMTE
jgi:hypothetical protein